MVPPNASQPHSPLLHHCETVKRKKVKNILPRKLLQFQNNQMFV